MTRSIAAAFVPQTAPEPTGLAGHPRPRRQGWRRVATAAAADRYAGPWSSATPVIRIRCSSTPACALATA
jgi:hypothetical protein